MSTLISEVDRYIEEIEEALSSANTADNLVLDNFYTTNYINDDNEVIVAILCCKYASRANHDNFTCNPHLHSDAYFNFEEDVNYDCIKNQLFESLESKHYIQNIL